MTPADFVWRVLEPGLALLPRNMDSPEARVFLVAAGGQESHWRFRRQIGGGTAHSYYQLEGKGGAVEEVLTSRGTAVHAVAACRALDIEPTLEEVYEAIVYCDALATVIGRLIPWLEPAPLPAIGDVDGAWACYERLWKPGRPAPERWPACYSAALAAFQTPPQAPVLASLPSLP